VNYEDSPLSQNRGNIGKGPKAGDRAPDGQLLNADGTPTTLFDLLRTTQFRLLIFQGSRRPGAAAQLVEAAQDISAVGDGLILPIVITTNEASPVASADGIVALSDPAGALHATYGAEAACLYLVRPDGYVGYRAPLADQESLHAYLKDNFGITVRQPNS
jgi:hypothetical protein